jgi:ubiquinone/menaquinone biosynthesis C-methylase UbiE
MGAFKKVVRARLRRWRVRRPHRRPAAVLDPAEGYRRWAATYADETNELQRMEAELRAELLEVPDGLRTLEVGAGAGRVTTALRCGGADVFAVDLVAEMLLSASDREAMRGRACVARAEALPFMPESFDLVVCALTLGHVADLTVALGSIVDRLRPAGVLVITDFHPDATRRGWQRSFASGGRTWAIEQHAHSLADYERILRELGCATGGARERSWGGQAVVFGLRAVKGRVSVEAPNGEAVPAGRR